MTEPQKISTHAQMLLLNFGLAVCASNQEMLSECAGDLRAYILELESRPVLPSTQEEKK